MAFNRAEPGSAQHGGPVGVAVAVGQSWVAVLARVPAGDDEASAGPKDPAGFCGSGGVVVGVLEGVDGYGCGHAGVGESGGRQVTDREVGAVADSQGGGTVLGLGDGDG